MVAVEYVIRNGKDTYRTRNYAEAKAHEIVEVTYVPIIEDYVKNANEYLINLRRKHK